MNSIIGKVERKKGLIYKVDKDGNIIESKYNILKDPYTLVTLTILILAALYYIEMSRSATNAEHFGEYCMKYQEIIKFWEDNTGKVWNGSSNINELISYYQNNYNKLNNISLFPKYG